MSAEIDGTIGHAAGTTHFAPAQRKDAVGVSHDIEVISGNPLLSGLMEIANGLFAVLNRQRQIIALNDAFLKLLGIENAAEVLGLRPGESLRCIHSHESPGGCGTSEYCSTCGAAISLMAAQQTRQPQEKTCALVVEKDRQHLDQFFSIRCCPIEIGGEMFLLFFMQDVSVQQYRSCIDRTFFHDINNILCSLAYRSEQLAGGQQPTAEKLQDLSHIVQRIIQEISIQNTLQQSLDHGYQPLFAPTSAQELMQEVEQVFRDSPLAKDKTLAVDYRLEQADLNTDFHLVSRILINMVANALEAAPAGGEVRLTATIKASSLSFQVWNPGAIPPDTARRIFQRNFSTKSDMGRGFGTYSMKLFGEQILGGSVGFESTPASGTTFSCTLPCAAPGPKEGDRGKERSATAATAAAAVRIAG
jgi:K+-sensing histidine kinase KdpD